MQLYCHLAECIRSYAPIYSFWLFVFKRMNGKMGSYHTNGHNISLHFARRSFASNIFAPCNWPAEFIGDFYPLRQKFNYRKGALVQESFQTVVAKSTQFRCVPFPPVDENSLWILKPKIKCWGWCSLTPPEGGSSNPSRQSNCPWDKGVTPKQFYSSAGKVSWWCLPWWSTVFCLMHCRHLGQAQLYLGRCSFIVYDPPMQSLVWQPLPNLGICHLTWLLICCYKRHGILCFFFPSQL